MDTSSGGGQDRVVSHPVGIAPTARAVPLCTTHVLNASLSSITLMHPSKQKVYSGHWTGLRRDIDEFQNEVVRPCQRKLYHWIMHVLTVSLPSITLTHPSIQKVYSAQRAGLKKDLDQH